MNDLTLVIPAKKEKESLPYVLKELDKYKLNILIILEESDYETIKSINNFKCKIIYQSKKGYGNALIEGINKVDTKYFCIFNADGSFNPKRTKVYV
jgi:glycosyltransferase involved in cell wall biosynthesis